jgi:hypothetical protein
VAVERDALFNLYAEIVSAGAALFQRLQ